MDTIKDLGLFVETASNSVPKISTLKEFINLVSQMGYNSLYLGTADTYEIKEEPYFGYMRGRYTKEEFKDLDIYAKSCGIDLRPAIQTLGHLPFLRKYGGYDEIFDFANVLYIDNSKTYALIESMFRTMAENFTSRIINIGMDETYELGAGKFLQKNGYVEHTKLMIIHLKRVAEIAAKYGFTCEVWSDMFFKKLSNIEIEKDTDELEKLKGEIPSNVRLIHWTYRKLSKENFDNAFKKHRIITDKLGFAGAAYKWIGFAPDNIFSIEASNNIIDSCKDCKVDNVFFTLWADNGGESSLFSVLPALYYISEYNKGNCGGLEDIDKDKFNKITGVNFDDMLKLDWLNKTTRSKKYNEINNKSYYLLYNDLLMRDFDCLVYDGLGKEYENLYKELSNVTENSYLYVFKNLANLAKVLTIKAELSKNLYNAYKEKDADKLKNITNKDIPKVIEYLQEFYKSMQIQWNKENKSFGFEVQCIRLGGLLQRLEYVKSIINDYLKGNIESIEEYEVQYLPLNYSNKQNDPDSYYFNQWHQIATHGFL